MGLFASTTRLAGMIRAVSAYGSLEGGSGCGSGEAQVVSDFRFEKPCPCQSLGLACREGQKAHF